MKTSSEWTISRKEITEHINLAKQYAALNRVGEVHEEYNAIIPLTAVNPNPYNQGSNFRARTCFDSEGNRELEIQEYKVLGYYTTPNGVNWPTLSEQPIHRAVVWNEKTGTNHQSLQLFPNNEGHPHFRTAATIGLGAIIIAATWLIANQP